MPKTPPRVSCPASASWTCCNSGLLAKGGVHGGRIDTGVTQTGEVSPFYDPMIAKVIAHGHNREQARERLATMLAGSAVWPVKTNASFLVKALAHPAFVAGDVDTGLIGRDGEAMAQPPVPSAAALGQAAQRLSWHVDQPGLRLNAPPVRSATFLLDGDDVQIELTGPGSAHPEAAVLVTEAGQAWQLTRWRHHAAHGGALGDGAILSPMPGRIIAVEVEQGQAVTRGQKLLTLEAMKMEHTLVAPFDGIVAELSAITGAQVQVEALLARIVAHDEEDTK